ncbi:hypothetical protein [Chryseomicrobium excrementi]|nr:hypothetical protein [Chryseomicrobium excrementi]
MAWNQVGEETVPLLCQTETAGAVTRSRTITSGATSNKSMTSWL